MRRGGWWILAALAVVTFGGCRLGMGAARRPAAPLRWTVIAPDAVEVVEARPHHTVRFGVWVSAEAGRPRRLELRFARPLDSARVDAYATGPHHEVTLVEGARVPGQALAVALPPLALDRIEVVVHHHLRPAPLPPEVRLGQEGR